MLPHVFPSSSPPPRSLMFLATAVIVGCVDIKINDEWPCYGPVENCEEADTGIYVHEEPGTDTACMFEHASPNNGRAEPDMDAVVTHCVDYTGPDAGEPLTMTGTGACSVDGSTSPGAPWNPGDHAWVAQTTQEEVGSIPFLCETGTSGAVQFRFVPSTGYCSDYVDTGHNFLFWNNGYLAPAFSSSTADCSWVAEEAARELKKPLGMLGGSEPGGCTAGSATFDMVARHLKGYNNLGEASVQLVPIAESNAIFPARAWLRTIDVEDWGDVGMFRIASPGQDLTFSSNGSVTGGTQISAPTIQMSLSVGTATMGAVMGTASVADGDELPRVTLSWSCEVGSPAHYSSIPNHTGYLLDLSSYGIDHRAVVWVDQDAKMIRLAPRGRFMDHVLMPYDSSGHFKGVIQSQSTTIEGDISFSGSNVVLDDVTVTVAGISPITVSSPVTLSPL